MADALGEVLGILADHLPDDPVGVDLGDARLAGDPPIAQNRDVIADADQFLEPMRDIDDRDALRLEVRDDPEQHLDLRGAQGRGRLVHDQDAGILGHRLGDLDELLLADPQILHHGAGIDAGLQALHQGAGLPFLLLVVDAARGAHDLAGDEDILGHRQVAEQVEFLEHHADAVRDGIGRARKLHGLAVEHDAPERRLFDAGDDLHQGRLAGPVLADQHVDGAPAHLEGRVLDRERAGIGLGDILQGEHDVLVVAFAHDFGPIAISTGVTSAGAPPAPAWNTPSAVTPCPTRSERGSLESAVALALAFSALPNCA